MQKPVVEDSSHVIADPSLSFVSEKSRFLYTFEATNR